MSHGESTLPRQHPSAKSGTLPSPLLERIAGLTHGFTLRELGDFAPPVPARERLLHQTGGRRLLLLRQVHGTDLVSAEEPFDENDEPPEADGWMGHPAPGDILGVRTADCLPVLLVHPTSGALALLHAGWRGATASIAARAAEGLATKWSAPAEGLVAALGPCIRPCCYEVGEEVADAAGDDPRWLRATGGGKYRFDLQGYVRAELEATGVAPDRIDALDHCTACDARRFFSHRARLEPQRMVAFMAWRETR